MKIDRESIQFFIAFGFIGLIIQVFAKELNFLSYIFFFLALFTLFFFRDPKRNVPSGEAFAISPADGKIIKIQKVIKDGQEYHMISIFMSVFNVHINRSPISGTVKEIRYNPGKFLPAFNDKASAQNEQTEIKISSESSDVIVKQIAGLIARRIVLRIREGQKIEKGQKIGLIRFGSRVDLFLPLQYEIKVKTGEKAVGGKTIIGEKK